MIACAAESTDLSFQMGISILEVLLAHLNKEKEIIEDIGCGD